MTALPNSHVISNTETLLELIAAPFRALGDLLIRVGENHPRAKAIEELSQISDEQLAAQGLTRVEAVRHVLGTYY